MKNIRKAIDENEGGMEGFSQGMVYRHMICRLRAPRGSGLYMDTENRCQVKMLMEVRLT